MKIETKCLLTFLFTAGLFGTSLAFWSLDTDLQFGYEIYDRSYEINAAIQAILTASSRTNIVQNDPTTQSSVIALNSIASQLQSAPITFFSELGWAASSRLNDENYHLSRLRTYHATYMTKLESLSNSTGALRKLEDITNPSIMQALSSSINRIKRYSVNVLAGVEEITLRVAQIRANSSLLLTPKLIDEFINNNHTESFITSLTQLRNSYLHFLSSVRDTARLTGAYGSMYDILDRSYTKDNLKRNTSLFNFVNSYNRVRNTLLSSVVSYRQTAQTEFTKFIQRVQSTYDDTIVRPRFDREQLPQILAFADVVTSKVYNQTFFETSFDSMKDAIVNLFTNETNNAFAYNSQYRDAILDLLRQSFVRHYASCLNELVSESQQGLNALTGKYSYCLDERTSSITVVIPSTSTWLGVIRDNVNFILQQLNACLNGLTSVAGRTATSECIQSNTNNLQFYSMYLPLTVQTNLRPIVESPPLIFRNCIGVIKASNNNYDSFKEIYDKCSESSHEGNGGSTEAPTTHEPTYPPTDPTTEQPTDAPTTQNPTYAPTEQTTTEAPPPTEELTTPTNPPTEATTESSTLAPTDASTTQDTTYLPTEAPTNAPTEQPTEITTDAVTNPSRTTEELQTTVSETDAPSTAENVESTTTFEESTLEPTTEATNPETDETYPEYEPSSTYAPEYEYSDAGDDGSIIFN